MPGFAACHAGTPPLTRSERITAVAETARCAAALADAVTTYETKRTTNNEQAMLAARDAYKTARALS